MAHRQFVDLRRKNGGSFHSHVTVYQRDDHIPNWMESHSKFQTSKPPTSLKTVHHQLLSPDSWTLINLILHIFLVKIRDPQGEPAGPPIQKWGRLQGGNGGRRWQKCIVSVSFCDENGTTYEQKNLTQLCKWEILGQSGIPLSQLAVRY